MGEWSSKIVEIATVYGARIVGVLAILLAAWTVGGWAKRTIAHTLEAKRFDLSLGRFFANVVRYVIIGGAVIGVLGVFGIQTTSFAAIIAAMGLAVGLAFQGALSNFAAGVMLLVFRPFKVGDVVEAAGIVGKVDEIDLFTTEITTADNRRIIVPNGGVFGGVITNLTHHPQRRVEVEVGVAYSADLDRTRQVLEEALRSVPGIVDTPPPAVYLAELGASSVDYKLRAWCKTEDFWQVREAIVTGAKRALDAAALSIPFPQMDVHLDQEVVQALSGPRSR